jgi:predicted CopG family antitoxin
MKTINVTFTDEEYEQLLKTKNGTNWHDFIMELVK